MKDCENYLKKNVSISNSEESPALEADCWDYQEDEGKREESIKIITKLIHIAKDSGKEAI